MTCTDPTAIICIWNKHPETERISLHIVDGVCHLPTFQENKAYIQGQISVRHPLVFDKDKRIYSIDPKDVHIMNREFFAILNKYAPEEAARQLDKKTYNIAVDIVSDVIAEIAEKLEGEQS